MKRLAIFFLSTMAVAAMAQGTASNPDQDPAAAPASDTAAAVQPASTHGDTKEHATDRNCLKETGSRLAPRPDSKGRKCVNASGRAYSKEDLDRTGAIDLSDALRRLDPAVH
ncbi:MAG: hypothetical protein ABI538_13215 [Pseudoxanthomonas sp.]